MSVLQTLPVRLARSDNRRRRPKDSRKFECESVCVASRMSHIRN